MLILGLLGMYFDAMVVFFTTSSLFFRLAMGILCVWGKNWHSCGLMDPAHFWPFFGTSCGMMDPKISCGLMDTNSNVV